MNSTGMAVNSSGIFDGRCHDMTPMHRGRHLFGETAWKDGSAVQRHRTMCGGSRATNTLTYLPETIAPHVKLARCADPREAGYLGKEPSEFVQQSAIAWHCMDSQSAILWHFMSTANQVPRRGTRRLNMSIATWRRHPARCGSYGATTWHVVSAQHALTHRHPSCHIVALVDANRIAERSE